MSIRKEVFGTTKEGKKVYVYTMKNKNQVEAQVINLGAVLMKLFVPDKNGTLEDVVLGFEDVKSYEINGPSFGAVVGRNANRIRNAEFTIDGVTYYLEKNNGENNLHGGLPGFARVVYEAEVLEESGQDTVTFHRVSPHMEQGFPGNLTYSISYTLTDENELVLTYHAKTDQDTVVNMTNHSYFNLAGHRSGLAVDHKLRIYADRITKADEGNVPTGEYLLVKGTPFDFTQWKRISEEIDAEYEPLRTCHGYDHNYVIEQKKEGLVKAAELLDERSGRHMEVYTNMPGLQLYTCNGLDLDEGCTYKEYADYKPRHGICLETQFYPNACNIDAFPSSVLKKEDTYDFTTVYKFV